MRRWPLVMLTTGLHLSRGNGFYIMAFATLLFAGAPYATRTTSKMYRSFRIPFGDDFAKALVWGSRVAAVGLFIFGVVVAVRGSVVLGA